MAGLSHLGSTKIVITAGLAELASGAISMGFGGYLAALTDRDNYEAEEKREKREVENVPEAEKREIYSRYIDSSSGGAGCRQSAVDSGEFLLPLFGVRWRHQVVSKLSKVWFLWGWTNRHTQFIMDFELKPEKSKRSRARISGVVIGISYVVGGLIPMIPYFKMTNAWHAAFVSATIAAVLLMAFGFGEKWEDRGTLRGAMWRGAQMMGLRPIAAGLSFEFVIASDRGKPGLF